MREHGNVDLGTPTGKGAGATSPIDLSFNSIACQKISVMSSSGSRRGSIDCDRVESVSRAEHARADRRRAVHG